MAKENESTMKWKVDISNLKAAMQEARRSISQANAEFKTATAGMDRWSDSTTGLEAKLKQLNTVLPAQKRQLEVLEAQYKDVVATQGENSNAAADLRLKMEQQRGSIAKTESSITKYNDQLNALKAEEKEAQAPMNQLNKTIGDQEAKLDSLKNEYANTVLQFGKNSKEAKDLGKQIADLSGELNQNRQKLKDATSAADDFDKGMDDAEKETKEASDEADKASGKFSGLGDAMANAAKVGIAAFATAIAGAVGALSKASVDAAAYADEMLTMSTVTGVSTDALQKYSYAADLIDVSMETLTGSMRKNFASMRSAASGTGAMADAYAELGVSVTDANGNLLDSEQVFWNTVFALGQISDETERDALSMQLFGKSAQELNPLIETSWTELAALSNEAKEMGAVLSDDQIADLGAFDDSIQRLTQGSEAAKRALGLVLLPQLQELADGGVGLLQEFTSGLIEAGGDWDAISEVIGSTVGSATNMILQQMPNIISVATSMVSAIGSALLSNLPMIASALSQGLVQLVQAFGSGLPMFIDAGMQAIIAIVTGLTTAIPDLIAMIPTVIQGVMDAILENLPLLLEAGMTLLQAILEGIMTALPELMAYVPVLVTSFCDMLTENLPQILEMGINTLMSLINGLVEALPELIEMVPTIIKTIVETLTKNLPLILQMGISTLLTLINGLVEALPELIKMLPDIINTIISVLTENLPLILQMGIDVLVELINGLVQAIPDLVAMIPTIISTIVEVLIENLPLILEAGVEIIGSLIEGIGSVLGDLGEMMLEVGSNIVSGIWEGISGGYEWIKEKISGWVDNVVGFIKDVFGIASPSKVLADEVGEFLPSGIAVGFDKDMPSALADMKSTMTDAMNDLKTDVAVQAEGMFDGTNMASASGRSAGGYGSRQQVINFYQTNNSPKALDRLSVYRETNNLLFSAKVGLSNV